jgi:predicted 3-demethylubiquinone-9 3-methyltransferase (glyoxalase superfamily)
MPFDGKRKIWRIRALFDERGGGVPDHAEWLDCPGHRSAGRGLFPGRRQIEESDDEKNTICLWYDRDAEEAARFYARTFPDSTVGAVHRAPSDFPSGKAGDVLTVEFTVCGVPCVGLNGGDMFKHSEAFSFQIATDDQAETDRYWNAIVGNGGAESACGWCKDKWGLSWQITPRVLTDAMARGGAVAKRAFEAMMEMRKIDVAKIEAAVRGEAVPG